MLVNPADKTTQEVELGEGETSQVVLHAVGGGDSRFLYWATVDDPTPTPAPTPDPAPQPRTGQWKSGYFGWWYSYSDGTYAANETLVIDGQTYRFDASGYLKMGLGLRRRTLVLPRLQGCPAVRLDHGPWLLVLPVALRLNGYRLAAPRRHLVPLRSLGSVHRLTVSSI